jgi:hypothetical protein
MRQPLIRLGPVLWVLCACLLLLPQAAAAGGSLLAVDFDGDGRRDSVRLDQNRPSVLRVWLSASGTTQVLVSRGPLHRVAATDLDGDNRPELIATDRQSRLHVWTTRERLFHRYHPRRLIPQNLSAAGETRVDGRNREPEEVLTGATFGPSELSRPLLLAPPDRLFRACAPADQHTRQSYPSAQPFSPRPPPGDSCAISVRRRA